MIYHQTTLENPSANIRHEDPPAPASNATRYLNDTCLTCGAEDHISGAHKHDGTWMHTPAISCTYGWCFPDMDRYPEVFAEPITQTRLVDGRCAWCRGGAK